MYVCMIVGVRERLHVCMCVWLYDGFCIFMYVKYDCRSAWLVCL